MSIKFWLYNLQSQPINKKKQKNRLGPMRTADIASLIEHSCVSSCLIQKVSNPEIRRNQIKEGTKRTRVPSSWLGNTHCVCGRASTHSSVIAPVGGLIVDYS